MMLDPQRSTGVLDYGIHMPIHTRANSQNVPGSKSVVSKLFTNLSFNACLSDIIQFPSSDSLDNVAHLSRHQGQEREDACLGKASSGVGAW